jgi:uncharacterized protein (DUF924 family)
MVSALRAHVPCGTVRPMMESPVYRPNEAKDPRAAEVLGFWFGTREEYGQRRKCWFEKDDAFDAEVRARFLALHGDAARGALAAWRGACADCLALIVVLDQFSRHLYRGTALAFASDAKALAVAQYALENRYDDTLLPVERMFAYLPFEHSEALAHQLAACELVEPLTVFEPTKDAHRFAIRHCDVIRRFGRFPHRNAALGRVSSAEELEFLKEPGSGF